MSSSRRSIKRCALVAALALGGACSGDGGTASDAAPDARDAQDAAADAELADAAPEALDALDAAPDARDDVAETDMAEVDAPDVVVAAAWDPEPVRTMACAPDRAMPLMDTLVTAAGLTRDTLGFSAEDYAGSRYFSEGHLDDAFLLPGFRAIQAAPLQATCWADAHAGALDDVARGAHPVAAMIRRAAVALDRFADGPPVLPAPAGLGGDAGPHARLAQALADALAAAGHPYAPPLAEVVALPPELAADLVPLVVALGDALAAHRAMAERAPTTLTTRAWIEQAGFGMVPAAQFQFLQKPVVRAHLLGQSTLPPLFLAAARVAYAVESVDWSRHRGREAALTLATPIGRVLVRGPGVDTYAAPGDAAVGDDALPVLLLVDTGGDDVHRDDIGATTDPRLGVSVAIDLGGDDDYGFEAHVDEASGLVADDHGRARAGDPATSNGAVTESRHGRQGAGRHGIGMLFDLGGGADRYASLAASQGYGALGVGVLFDDGGRDTYTSEVASQGAAMCGIGLLVDRGADGDVYRVVNSGQGMGGVRGFGALFDAGGDDVYDADPGPIGADPARGVAPQPLYMSPQMAGQANTSMAQGASTGIRWDAAELWLSGGIGVLRDAGGDDAYRAGLFAQGAGYWQGIGVLADAAGADHYDALYYVQGAGAHYAVGLLLDGGPGGDIVNQGLPPQYVQLGSGHDFTLGVFVNEAGDDTYRFAGLAAGASNCNGIGVFVDNGGDDRYETGSDYGSGMGNVSGECLAARPGPKSVGLMLDAGGVDTYGYPATSEFPLPSDGGAWGHVRNGLPSEHGAGLDGEGDSGLHAP